MRMGVGIAHAHRSAHDEKSSQLLDTGNGIAAVEMTAIELDPMIPGLRRDEPWPLVRYML